MRVLYVVLALFVASAAVALAQSTSSDTSAAATNPSSVGTGTAMGNQMVDTCLTNTLGLSAAQIQDLRSQGLTESDIAMASAIATKSGKSITTVAADFKTMGNWSDVAKKYNVSMSDLASAPACTNPDEEAFNAQFTYQYYGVPQSTSLQLRKQGFSWSAIDLMANASIRTSQPISQIATDRSSGMSWTQIANKYNVSPNDITKPVAAQTVASATTAGAGPIPAGMPVPVIANNPVMYDRAGNVLLTNDEAWRYYFQGYDWMDVAVAANISMETGYPIQQILLERRTGSFSILDLPSVYGVDRCDALNLCNYPFAHRGVYGQSIEAANMAALSPYQHPSKVFGPRNSPETEACGPRCAPVCKPVCAPTCAPTCAPPAPVGTGPNTCPAPVTPSCPTPVTPTCPTPTVIVPAPATP